MRALPFRTSWPDEDVLSNGVVSNFDDLSEFQKVSACSGMFQHTLACSEKRFRSDSFCTKLGQFEIGNFE